MEKPVAHTFKERFDHWITLLGDFNYDLSDAGLWLPKEAPDQLRETLNALDQRSELNTDYLNILFHSVVAKSFLSVARLSDEQYQHLFQSDAPLGDRVSTLLEHCPDGEQFTSMMMSRWLRFDRLMAHRHDDPETVLPFLFPNHSLFYSDLCPIFPELPDLLDQVAAYGRMTYSSERDFYEHTLPIFAKDVRERMAGVEILPSFVSDMSRVAHIPKPLRPMDQVLDAMIGIQSAFSREMASRILNDYTVYDFERHLDKVNALIDSFPSASQQYTTLENMTRDMIKDARFNERLLPMIAPDKLVAERVFLDAPISSFHDLMNTDYLITLINAHQHDPNGMLRQFDPNEKENADRQQSFMVDQFAPRLTEILERLADRDAYPKLRYLRELATLFRETDLPATLQNIINETSPQLSFHVDFLDEAVDFIRPLLKKSLIDELMTEESGHTLHSDIVLIADVTSAVADFSKKNSNTYSTKLRSINKPLERINGYIMEREARNAGLESDIDLNTMFDKTL